MNYFEWYYMFIIVVSILYGALILWFTNGWRSIPYFKTKPISGQTKTSIIIPFYNEEKNLETCIQQIIPQIRKHASIELILIDDNSNDNSLRIAQDLAQKASNVQVIQNSNKGKKQALIKGISHAKGELVITTDSDCSYAKDWVQTMISFYESTKADLIIAPVKLKPVNKLIEHFQYLEFTSLVASAAGAAGINHPIMCNAANLAFSKASYLKLQDPFNLNYESGDDVFLLHAMKKLNPNRIEFLKSEEALVTTRPQTTLKGFFYQRQRWASKAKGYSDKDTIFTGTIILSQSMLLLFGLFALIFRIQFWQPLVIGLAIKSLTDYYFFYQIEGIFKTKKYLPYIFGFECFYVLYIAIAAMLGVSENNWKRN